MDSLIVPDDIPWSTIPRALFVRDLRLPVHAFQWQEIYPQKIWHFTLHRRYTLYFVNE